MSTEKLSWAEIEKLYDQQWVELVDFDWPDEEPLPKSGVIKIHAKSRREFDELIVKDPPANSALLFVGKRQIPAGLVLSANLHQPTQSDR